MSKVQGQAPTQVTSKTLTILRFAKNPYDRDGFTEQVVTSDDLHIEATASEDGEQWVTIYINTPDSDTSDPELSPKKRELFYVVLNKDVVKAINDAMANPTG